MDLAYSLNHYLKRATRDASRTFCQMQLYNELAKFVFSALGLGIPEEIKQEKSELEFQIHLAKKIMECSSEVEAFRHRLLIEKHLANFENWPYLDASVASFDSSGHLSLKSVLLDEKYPCLLSEDQKVELIHFIENCYNTNLEKHGIFDPVEFHKTVKVLRKNHSAEESIFVERVVSSAFFTFKTYATTDNITNDQRVVVPKFSMMTHPGFSSLNFSCVISPDRSFFDFWFQINHAVVDGGPASEFIVVLRKNLGVTNQVQYEPNRSYEFRIEERGSIQTAFVNHALDFTPLLELKAKFSKDLNLNLPYACFFLWLLGQHKGYQGEIFSVLVDRPATALRKRSLANIVISPGAYFNKNRKHNGFLDFAKAFGLKLKMARAGLLWTLYSGRAMAMLPANLQSALYKNFSSQFRPVLGTIPVSMMGAGIYMDICYGAHNPLYSKVVVGARRFAKNEDPKNCGVSMTIRADVRDIKKYSEGFREMLSNLDSIFF